MKGDHAMQRKSRKPPSRPLFGPSRAPTPAVATPPDDPQAYAEAMIAAHEDLIMPHVSKWIHETGVDDVTALVSEVQLPGIEAPIDVPERPPFARGVWGSVGPTADMLRALGMVLEGVPSVGADYRARVLENARRFVERPRGEAIAQYLGGRAPDVLGRYLVVMRGGAVARVYSRVQRPSSVS
jgi:hypothetical protein